VLLVTWNLLNLEGRQLYQARARYIESSSFHTHNGFAERVPCVERSGLGLVRLSKHPAAGYPYDAHNKAFKGRVFDCAAIHPKGCLCIWPCLMELEKKEGRKVGRQVG
jgi:hypothetical protein